MGQIQDNRERLFAEMGYGVMGAGMLQNNYPVPAKYDARKGSLRPRQHSTPITQIKRCIRNKDDVTNPQNCQLDYTAVSISNSGA